MDALRANEEGRYAIDCAIGEGAGGVVYRARDRESGELVALKTLANVTAAQLLQLKNEFRTLSGLHHPNLVRLGEFFEEDGRTYLAMELVVGCDFLTFVAAHSLRSGTKEARSESAASGQLFDDTRLRSALSQLASAVSALHAAGIVHRDLKPENVLVTTEGRVVVLDFGTALREKSARGTDAGVTGTALYMAPEQVLGEEIGPRADWYAVGVMLFRALTGTHPFEGDLRDVMGRKVLEDAPSAESVWPDLPVELCDLADRLLALEPSERAGYAEVAECLHLRAVSHPPVQARECLFGRDGELQWLADAASAASRGEATAVVIRGESGVGKSLLLHTFLERIVTETPDATVLFSRCYERSSVPFKALDGAMEALAGVLADLSPSIFAPWLGEHAGLVPKLFPELGVVPALAQRERTTSFAVNENPKEARRRAFEALRGLFRGLTSSALLVLVVDDLQWSDDDSVSLLRTLLEPPDPPPLLLLCTARVSAEGADRGADIAARISPTVRSLKLEKLPRAQAQRFVEQVVEQEEMEPLTPAELEALLTEAAGHPMFLTELLHQGRGGAHHRLRPLDEFLRERVQKLPTASQAMLQAVCVAAMPIPQSVAGSAAALHGAELLGAVPELCAVRLVQTWGEARKVHVEPYHDRVREAVVAGLSAEELAAWHGKLAAAFERGGVDAPDTLAAHWLGAGENQKALEYVCKAAERASASLAFDRTAQYYEQAIKLCEDPARLQVLRVAVASALTLAGRGPEAARASLLAAETASPDDAVELQRRAAEQFVISGHLQEGSAALDAVLSYFHLAFARTRLLAIIAVLIFRLRALLQGYKLRARDPSQITKEELQRLDVLWSTSTGLSVVDSVRGAEFSARHLLLAMKTGDRARYYRALIVEACYQGAQNAEHRAARMLESVRKPCESGEFPHLVPFHELGIGWQAYFNGHFRLSQERSQQSRDAFEKSGLGARWEVDMTTYWGLCAGIYLGELKGVADRLPRYLNDAHDRGDLFLETLLRFGNPAVVWIANDDTDAVTEAIRELLPRWPSDRYLIQHMYAVWSRTLIDLYDGGGPKSVVEAESSWPALEKALHLRVRISRVRALQLLSAAHLGAAELTASPKDNLAKAERAAKQILAMGQSWGDGWARLLLAGVEFRRDRLDVARTHLAQAIPLLEKAETGLHLAAARIRLGDLVGGDEGGALRGEGMAFLSRQGVKVPEKFLRAYAPGFARGRG